MTEQEIFNNLCDYDKRSPYYNPNYAREPRTVCSCMNCFHGRDELAVEILRLRARQAMYKDGLKFLNSLPPSSGRCERENRSMFRKQLQQAIAKAEEAQEEITP